MTDKDQLLEGCTNAARAIDFAMIRRIRSSRQIEYEVKHSIDFNWLTSGRRIDHTTLSEFRRKHTSELRDIFNQMIKLAINLKVANLAELYIDSTRVLADANKYKTWTTEKLTRSGATRPADRRSSGEYRSQRLSRRRLDRPGYFRPTAYPAHWPI